MSPVGISSGSECAAGLCYCCAVPQEPAHNAQPLCPNCLEETLPPAETMCARCREVVLAECGCDSAFWTMTEFRELPLDQVITVHACGSIETGSRYRRRGAGAMANRASAIDLIRAERGRQISKGWTADHDDTHVHGEISVAAADLLLHSTDERRTHNYHETDAWGLAERHCKDDVKSLVIAGALVVAELERVVLSPPDRLRQILANLVDVDVEGGREGDVANVVAAQIHVHQTGNGIRWVSVLVVLDTLEERRGAVAHSHDRHAHFARLPQGAVPESVSRTHQGPPRWTDQTNLHGDASLVTRREKAPSQLVRDVRARCADRR